MNRLDQLSDEIIIIILSFLDSRDLVNLQLVSSRYSSIARDNSLWKIECFDHSQAEALRNRQRLLNLQDPRLSQLRNAVSALPGGDLTAWDVSQLIGRAQQRASSDPATEARIQRTRALANWEPGYPGEKLDYYQEYIHRHAPVNIGWLDLPRKQTADKNEYPEATGVGLLSGSYGDGDCHIVAPLDDGSVCIWDITGRSTEAPGGQGRLIARSASGLLTDTLANNTTDRHAVMTETGAVECVSIDSFTNKAFFAVQDHLHEVDLVSMQIQSSKQYPFPITALSACQSRVPVTVGTNMNIHLYDPRDSAFATSGSSGDGELIGGSVYTHATLAQPGPLSILHRDSVSLGDSSIWVAGRFTSLLNYDRRFFPRLRGTIHSGARIASLSILPYPFIPRSLDLLRNPEVHVSSLQEARSASGITMMAAAEYKGKGSLELYGMPSVQPYQNRQTASSSKLLSVAPHGGRIVFSDGDGNLKWVERDGFTYVRTFNINDVQSQRVSGSQSTDASSTGIWSSTGSALPGQGDIVQKILPICTTVVDTQSRGDRPDINRDNLLLWTGDGRIGMLGFGQTSPFGEESWHDALEEQNMTTEQKARHDAERQYGMAMRRALERNANEVRFVRGLGMGFMR